MAEQPKVGMGTLGTVARHPKPDKEKPDKEEKDKPDKTGKNPKARAAKLGMGLPG